MAGYVLAFVWLVGAVFCDYVAGKRGVRKTAVRTILFAVFGPLAIPFVYVIRPEKSVHSE